MYNQVSQVISFLVFSFQSKILYLFLIFSTRFTRPAYSVILDLMSLIICDEGNK